jgi:molybdopterin-binding protein
VELIIPGKVISQDNGLVEVACGSTTLHAVSTAPQGTNVYLCLRPEDITLSLPDASGKTSARNKLVGNISMLIHQGPLTRVVINGPINFTSLVTRTSAQEMGLTVGQEIRGSFKTSAIHVIVQKA